MKNHSATPAENTGGVTARLVRGLRWGSFDLRIRRGGVIADLSDIHRIEHIVRTAVVAVHINFAVFRHDAVDLFIRQGFQRASAALARAGALKLHRLRVVDGHFFFVVQTPQHVGRRQVEQLFRFDGFGQRRQVLKIIGLSVLRRQNLQQHPPPAAG